jgi:7-keto-8-aminopelargonate synthetase-like enzyme
MEVGTCGASLYALDYVQQHQELSKTQDNTALFNLMSEAGFNMLAASTPLRLSCSQEKDAVKPPASCLLSIYVVGFSFPVVPKGSAHSCAD